MTRVLAVASEVFPLVKAGGLADGVGALPRALANEAALASGVATGIRFAPATAGALGDAVGRAARLRRDAPAWRRTRCNAMAADASWRRPAARYAALYRSLQAERA